MAKKQPPKQAKKQQTPKQARRQAQKMPARQGAGILWSILSGNGIPVSDNRE